MKNYYFILGLNINAGAADIKHAYRKLALQFHPDKNPSQQAEAIFKEINEAYEILSDPAQKSIYDQLLVGATPTATIDSRPHRDPRYRPRPPGPVVNRGTRRKEILEMMRHFLPYALMMSRLTLVFSLLLIADYSLPEVKIHERVIDLESTGVGRAGSGTRIEMENGKALNVNRGVAMQFRNGATVTIYRTAWFSVPRQLENEQTHFKASVPLSIYGNFAFIPLVLLITSLLGTFYWKGVEFRFNLGVVNFIMLLFNFVFLRIHTFDL